MLKGFERVTLAPGESREVAFDVSEAELATWNLAMKRVVEPGTYHLSVGSNSAELDEALLEVKTQ
jgi:beta-glucosidase